MPKKSTASKKPIKPSPEMVLTVQTLQKIVEDDAAWSADETAQFNHLRSTVKWIETLQKHQSFVDLRPSRTQADLQALCDWARDQHRVDLDKAGLALSFVNEDADNVTLYATRTIEPGESMITVPESMILSSRSSSSSKELKSDLATLSQFGRSIERSASLSLSLTLLMHRYQGDQSSFHPYINSLPSNFSTPLACFDDDPLYYSALAPSSKAQFAAVRTLRAQLRDYAGVFRAVLSAKIKSLPIHICSLVNFRWAISSVMTRQNALPNMTDPSPRSQPIMSLVPLWDMFNHANGPRTTSVTSSEGQVSVQCSAMKQFESNSPVTMCYGPRPSPQLALYSGFVPPNGTPYDEVHISISLHSELNEHLSEASTIQIIPLKARVLGKRGISIDLDKFGKFRCTVAIVRGPAAVDTLIGVAAVAAMGKQDFTHFLKSPNLVLPDAALISSLGITDTVFDIARDALMQAQVPYSESYEKRMSPPTEETGNGGDQQGNTNGNKLSNIDWESPAGKLISSLLDVENELLDYALEKLKAMKEQMMAVNAEDNEKVQGDEKNAEDEGTPNEQVEKHDTQIS